MQNFLGAETNSACECPQNAFPSFFRAFDSFSANNAASDEHLFHISPVERVNLFGDSFRFLSLGGHPFFLRSRLLSFDFFLSHVQPFFWFTSVALD